LAQPAPTQTTAVAMASIIKNRLTVFLFLLVIPPNQLSPIHLSFLQISHNNFIASFTFTHIKSVSVYLFLHLAHISVVRFTFSPPACSPWFRLIEPTPLALPPIPIPLADSTLFHSGVAFSPQSAALVGSLEQSFLFLDQP
jgi:hypothetical protein